MAVFAFLLSIAMLLARTKKTTYKEWVLVLGLAIVSNLLVLEQLQPLSLLFSVLGVAAIATWVALDRLVSWGRTLLVFLNITTLGPLRFFGDIGTGLRGVRPQAGLGKQAASLMLPLAFGVIFIAFFISANPFLERIADAVAGIEFMTPETMARGLFWLIAAALIWPYLNLPMFRVGPLKPRKPLPMPQGLGLVVNAASVRSSLILFNAIFAVQTGLDALVLSGGLTLPEGMSYAAYAHRGAYPLVASALLSGVFAIGTRRLIMQDRLMCGLVYVWLVQNLFLVLSAAFRLNLYVETYALTYLRVAAFIWMLLVFVGLLLVVLYMSSFANFAPMIARYYLLHPLSDGRVDANEEAPKKRGPYKKRISK